MKITGALLYFQGSVLWDSAGQMHVENVVRNKVWMPATFVICMFLPQDSPTSGFVREHLILPILQTRNMVGEAVTRPWSHSTRTQASGGSKAIFQGYFASVTCRGFRVVCWMRCDQTEWSEKGSQSRWQWADFKESRGFLFTIVSPFPVTRPAPCKFHVFHRYWLNELIGKWRSYSCRDPGAFGNVFALTAHSKSFSCFAFITCQAVVLNDLHLFKTWILKTIQRINHTTTPFFQIRALMTFVVF